MKFCTSVSEKENTQEALEEILKRISGANELVMVYGTSTHNWQVVGDVLRNHFSSNTQIIGATSCFGIMTNMGFCSNGGNALGAVGISDFSGDIGVGSCFVGNTHQKTQVACEQLLKVAKRQGELPDFIWVLNSPGDEEGVIEEINKYFKTNIRIFGGSCGDNEIKEQWKLMHNGICSSEGVVLVGFFSPDDQILSLFHSGYAPTNKKAVVTKCEGREILELDNRPAVEVYDNWLSGDISQVINNGNNNILGDSTLTPLGRIRGTIRQIPYYLLSHPSSVSDRKGITLFTNVQEGDEVFLMVGSITSLQKRLAEVVKTLLKREGLAKEDIAGALIVYCAGCMLAVNEHGLMDSVTEKLKEVLGEVPFMGIHTFGEQGNFFEGDSSDHGNLMISATLFKRAKNE